MTHKMFINKINKIFDELGLIDLLFIFYKEDIIFIDNVGGDTKPITIDSNRKIKEGNFCITSQPNYVHGKFVYRFSMTSGYGLENYFMIKNIVDVEERTIKSDSIPKLENSQKLFNCVCYLGNKIVKLYYISPDGEIFEVDSFEFINKKLFIGKNAKIYGRKVIVSIGSDIYVHNNISGVWFLEDIYNNQYIRSDLPGTDFYTLTKP